MGRGARGEGQCGFTPKLPNNTITTPPHFPGVPRAPSPHPSTRNTGCICRNTFSGSFGNRGAFYEAAWLGKRCHMRSCMNRPRRE